MVPGIFSTELADLPIIEGSLGSVIPPLLGRAQWLENRLLERGWGKADPYSHGGPDRKTIEKILRGETVRNDVLLRLAEALSKRHGNVTVIEIPQD